MTEHPDNSPESSLLQYRFEGLLARLSTQLMSLELTQVDHGLVDCLNQVVEALPISRAYLFQFTSDLKEMSITHEGTGEGVPSRQHEFQHVSCSHYQDLVVMLKSSKPVMINNLDMLTEEQSLLKSELLKSNTMAIVLVPLLNEDKLIGTLGLSCPAKVNWPQPLVDALRILGDLITGVLISHERLWSLEIRQKFQFTLTTLSKRFINLETNRFDSEIQKAMESIAQICRCDRFSMFLQHSDPKFLYLAYEHCQPEIRPSQKGEQLNQWKNISEPVAEQLRRFEPVLINQIDQYPDEYQPLKQQLAETEMNSVMYVPLVEQGQLIGYLGMSSRNPLFHWSSDHLMLMATFSDLMINAMRRKKTQSQLQRRNQFVELMSKVSARMINASIDEMDQVTNDVLEAVGNYMSVSACLLGMVKQNSSVHFQNRWQKPGLDDLCSTLPTMDLQALPESQQLVLGEPTSYPDLHIYQGKESNFLDVLACYGHRSCLMMPIHRNEELLAVLCLASVETGRSWSKYALQQLRVSGDIFLNALLRKQQDDQLHKQLDLEQFINNLASQLIHLKADRVSEAITNALQQMCQYLETDRAYIYEYIDEDSKISRQVYQWSAKEEYKPTILEVDARVGFEWSQSHLQNMKPIIIEDLSELPDEVGEIKQWFEGRCITATIIVPMAIEGVLKGYLGFSVFNGRRKWKDYELTVLNVMSSLIINTMVRARQQEQLEKQLELEHFINDLATMLVSVRYEDLDQAIIDSLEQMASFLETERAYVYQFDDDSYSYVTMTHEWNRSEQTSAAGKYVHYPFDSFKWLKERLLSKKPMVVNDTKLIPPEAVALREDFDSRGIQASIAVPMVLDNKLKGWMGYSVFKQPRIWKEYEQTILNVMANLITNTMTQRRQQKMLSRQLELERYINEFAARLIRLKSADLDQEIGQCLEFLCDYLGCSRGYVSLLEPGSTSHFQFAHSWYASPEAKASEAPCRSTLNELLASSELLQSAKPIAIHQLASHADHCPRLGEELERQGVKAALFVPLMSNGMLSGIIEFICEDEEHFWEEYEQTILSVISNLIIQAMERRRAEEEVHAYDQRLRLMTKSIAMGYFDLQTSEMRMHCVNPEISTTPQQHPLNTVSTFEDWLSAIHPDDQENIRQAMEEQSLGESQEFETEYRLKTNRSPKWILLRTRTVEKDRSGKAVRIVGAQIDLTTRKEFEAEREKLISELEQKNRELEQFTYTVSHDIKAPLITISGFAGLLKEDIQAENSNAIDEDLDHILGGAKHLEQLLNELLELSRIGRIVHPPEVIPTREMLTHCLSTLEAPQRKHFPRITIPDEIPEIYGDRLRLQMVFQNIIENAIKFGNNDGNDRIEIECQQNEVSCTFSIRDNGIGIDPSYQEKVFGLFERLDQHVEGTGLGLAIARRIIEFHEGRIWLESEGVGQGTTVWIQLPKPPQTGE